MKNKMTSHYAAKLLTASLLLLANYAFASDIVFICHKGNALNAKEIRTAYTAYFDEPKIVDNKALRPKLLQYLNMSEHQYKKMWEKQYFRRALTPPVVKKDDREVVDYVESHDAGVGYVAEVPHGADVEVCGK